MKLRRMYAVVGIVICIAAFGICASKREAKWEPPKTDLPAEFVAAVKFTFDHGVPDPRGGEFREVTITGGEPWQGRVSKAKVTGWVMPANGNSKPVVICWNGLPYRSFEAGAKVDLADFVKSKVGPQDGLSFMGHGTGELAEAGNPKSALAVALLLRTGHADLAEAIAGPRNQDAKNLTRVLYDDVVWFRFNRGVLAYMRSDDKLALEDATWLNQHAGEFDALRQTPGIPTPQPSNDYKALFVEASRRTKLGPRAPFDPVKNKALPTAERVADITAHLDDAQGFMWGQPGGIDWMGDQLYKAAMETGEPMLDALLDCAEKDARLTRAVGFGRDFFRLRYFVPVRQLSLLLISDISGIHSLPETADRRVDMKALRALISSTKGASLPDRLVHVLANDSAGPRQWLDAAQSLVQPTNQRRESGWVSTSPSRPGAPAPQMRGEPLRQKRNPSVTELMGKRALQMMPSGNWPSSNEMFAAKDSIRMAGCLAKWDPKGGRVAFKRVYDRVVATIGAFTQYTPENWKGDALDMLGSLVLFRMQAGDESATSDYEGWIYKSKPFDEGFPSLERLMPLVEQPEWGERVAKRLFLGDNALWSPGAKLRTGNRSMVDALLKSKLLVLQPVRECLCSLMKDTTVIGEVWREKGGGVRYAMNAGHGAGGWSVAGMEKSDSRDPEVGAKVQLRACDMLAGSLASFDGAPVFRPYWSAKDKDAAIREMIRFVNTAGSKLVDARPERMRMRG